MEAFSPNCFSHLLNENSSCPSGKWGLPSQEAGQLNKKALIQAAIETLIFAHIHPSVICHLLAFLCLSALFLCPMSLRRSYGSFHCVLPLVPWSHVSLSASNSLFFLSAGRLPWVSWQIKILVMAEQFENSLSLGKQADVRPATTKLIWMTWIAALSVAVCYMFSYDSVPNSSRVQGLYLMWPHLLSFPHSHRVERRGEMMMMVLVVKHSVLLKSFLLLLLFHFWIL